MRIIRKLVAWTLAIPIGSVALAFLVSLGLAVMIFASLFIFYACAKIIESLLDGSFNEAYKKHRAETLRKTVAVARSKGDLH